MVKDLWRNGKNILTRPQSSIFSAAFVIALTYSVSMVLGILRERLLAARFYLCCRSDLDVYYAAFRLPDMIFQLVVIGALSAAFIPVFSKRLAEDEKDANYLASSLINLLMAFFLVFAVIVFIFAEPFSKLITGNFTPDQISLMSSMTRAMLLAQIFFLFSNFLSAIIQSRQRFLLPSLSPVAYNLGIILSVLVLSPVIGVWAATLGVVVGAFLHLIIQLPLVFKLGFKYSFKFDWRHSGVRQVVKLMLPRTLSLAVTQIEQTVSLFLATSLSPGSLTIYYLAQRLSDLPVRLLGTSIGQAALPTMSLQLAKNQKAEFLATLRQALNEILYLALPAAGIFLVLRLQLVRFFYGARSFPWDATVLTGQTMAAITLSIFPQCAIQLLVRAFYALHDTNTPFIVSIFSVLLDIGLSLLLIFKFNLGIFGLAIGFSLSNYLTWFLLLVLLIKREGKFVDRKEVFHYFQLVVIAFLASVVSWISMKFMDAYVFDTAKAIPLLSLTIISCALGAAVYLYLTYLFRFEEFKVIVTQFNKISRWRKALTPLSEIIEPQQGVTGNQ